MTMKKKTTNSRASCSPRTGSQVLTRDNLESTVPDSIDCPRCNRPMLHTVKLNRNWHSCEVCDGPDSPDRPDIIMLVKEAEDMWNRISSAAAQLNKPKRR